MDSQCSSGHNRTTGCEKPSVVSSDGERTPLKPSEDRNQSLNAVGSSSGCREGISSFPPTFSCDDQRPLQCDLFRHIALFYTHLVPEEESDQWANFLPEYLRPGNVEKYLEETDKPRLYGDNYWWLSPKNFAQEKPSFNQSSDHIRYSRVELLDFREAMAIPESILKIKQEIDGECLGVNHMTKGGGINVVSIPVNSMNDAPQREERKKREGLASGSKKEMKKCRALINKRKQKRKIAEKRKGAEKIREVGVKKRLKIQPLVKPKPVSHCRHYLKGRCNEGEKCRFSHDVQPLTKSIPCCHFARQSCMKGDNCPYDHDLSKYPCDKYASTGFCLWQDNCLFSHKVTPNQDPASTMGITKPGTKISNPPPQKPQFLFGACSRQDAILPAYNGSAMFESSKCKVMADQPVKVPRDLTFVDVGSSRRDKQPTPTSTFADVFVFGKNSMPDQSEKSQPSLQQFGNHNKTAFGRGKKDANVSSDSSALSSFSARLNALMKNTSSSGQRFSLSTSASGSSPGNSASADASKNGGARLKKPLSADEVWGMLCGKGGKK